ncbi:hypothetical protein LINGRAHAP2_LOCUS8988 [Linum grandiflorum]
MRHSSVIPDKSPPGFKRYVEKVLSLRYDFNLSKVIFSENSEESESDTDVENSLLARVIRYALSHETQHLVIYLPIHVPGDPSPYTSADLLGFNSDCSLKTLELSWFSFSNRFRCSGFQMLEKLDLFGCTFFADQVDDIVVVEPFASLPCLKDLTLIMLFGAGSNHDMRFRISGLQLLRLHLSFISYRKMEIYAPKLKHFKFEYLENHMVEFTELTVPSLEHAEIEVEYQDGENNKHADGNEYTKRLLIPLLHGMSNASSLVMCILTARLLGDISDYLEDQPSPFTRLKSLIIGSMWPGEDVSFAVLNYLLKGSSDAKPAVKFRSA